MQELRARRGNALLRVIAPDPDSGPRKGTDEVRKAGRRACNGAQAYEALVGEVRTCVTGEDLEGAREAVASSGPSPERCLRSCPSYALSMEKAPVAVSRALTKALAFATENPRSKKDPVR